MPVLFVDSMDFCDATHWAGEISPFLPSCKYTSFNRINVGIQPGLVYPGSSTSGVLRSLRFQNSGFGNQTYTRILGSRTSWCIGAAMNFNSIADSPVWRFEAGGTTTPGSGGGENASTALYMQMKFGDHTISIYTGPNGVNNAPGTLLWNSAGVYEVPLETVIFIEMSVDTSSGSFSVAVNDVVLHSQTGAAIPGGIDRFSLLSAGFETHKIDDLYVTDGERLGPCRVTGFAPNFGSTHQWTPLIAPNLSQIQEFGNRPGLNTPDDDQSYVSASGAGITDYYGFPSPPCYGRILALALNADGSAVSGSPSVDFLVKIAGVEYPAGFSNAYIGGYGIQQGISALNPKTGTFWSDAEIAAALFGYRFAGSGELKITQFMIEKLCTLRNVPFQCGGGAVSYVS